MNRRRTRRTVRTVVLTLAAAVTASVATAAPAGAAPGCSTAWGSQPKSAAASATVHDFVHAVRAGEHACFDRLVIDIGVAGRFDGYSVRYVDTVRQDGSGTVVPLRGGAKLQIVVDAMNHDEQGGVTYRPRNPRELVDVSGYRTFRQVAWAGAFEGQSTVGLGTRARLPFRVFTVQGAGTGPGARVVVDVAHRW